MDARGRVVGVVRVGERCVCDCPVCCPVVVELGVGDGDLDGECGVDLLLLPRRLGMGDLSLFAGTWVDVILLGLRDADLPMLRSLIGAVEGRGGDAGLCLLGDGVLYRFEDARGDGVRDLLGCVLW